MLIGIVTVKPIEWLQVTSQAVNNCNTLCYILEYKWGSLAAIELCVLLPVEVRMHGKKW